MMAATVPTDSLQALSGIRIALGMAIPAVPTTGKAKLMKLIKTRCKHGHAFTQDNTKIHSGRRVCMICWRLGSKLNHGFDRVAPHKSHCRHGHPFSQENTYYNARGWPECRACRNAAAERYAKRQASVPPSKEKIQALLSGLNEGRTICSLTEERYSHGEPVVMRRNRYNAILVAFPKLGRAIKRLAKKNWYARNLDAIHQRLASTRSSEHEPLSDDAYKIVVAATAWIPDYARIEVQSMIFEDLLARRLSLGQVRGKSRQFLSLYYKQNSKYVPVIGGVMQSLDQQVYEDGPTRLVDTVTHGLWD